MSAVRRVTLGSALVSGIICFTDVGLAANGARLIGAGPASRAMGGTGVALPQDAIGALTANPAALFFRPHADELEADFAGTVIFSGGEAEVAREGESFRGTGSLVSPIWNNALVMPAPELPIPVIGGLSIFASGGFGVDYRGTELDQPAFFSLPGGGRGPLVAGEFTRFQVLSAAPAVAFKALDWLAIGLGAVASGSALDLREGTSVDFGGGLQVGVCAQPSPHFTAGIAYASSQLSTFDHVADFDGDGKLDNTKIALPHVLSAGAAVQTLSERALFEVDGRWLRWSHANGFRENDWTDQWVLAVGLQLKPNAELALRAGYNLANSPVRQHNGFDGTAIVSVEGRPVPAYYYETGRAVGNAAVARQHFTAGVAYELNPTINLSVGAVYVLPETFTETGTDLLGQQVRITSKIHGALTLEFGLNINFEAGG